MIEGPRGARDQRGACTSSIAKGPDAVAETAVKAATESYERNKTRINEGVELPIETLQAIQALDQARREYVRTVVDYNAAQFRLHRAVGWAIQ